MERLVKRRRRRRKRKDQDFLMQRFIGLRDEMKIGFLKKKKRDEMSEDECVMYFFRENVSEGKEKCSKMRTDQSLIVYSKLL